jgi:hypothetical protein
MKIVKYNYYLKEYNEILFYILIGIVSFIVDISSGHNNLYNNCKDPQITLLLLFLHHLFAAFLYFGWLSNHKNILYLHISTILIVIIVQLNNNRRCPSTDIVNDKCNITRVNYLRDFLYFTNIKRYNLYYFYVFVAFIISCIKLAK